MFELARQVVILSLLSTANEYEFSPAFMFVERVAAVVLGLMWLGITGYILWQYVIKPRQSGGKKHHRSRRSRRAGKRCPQCQNLIDARRTVCQHCGHLFEATAPAEEEPVQKNAGEQSTQSSGTHRGHKRGKYCPQCHKLINRERKTCQHCGYVFFEARSEPPPSESQEPSD